MINGADAPGPAVVDALARELAGGQLLELARERDDLALVGGAVRDLLSGRRPRELDVTVERGSAQLGAKLAQRLHGELTVHERFGTAVVRSPAGSIDIAERRAETYDHPGALPQVRPGDLAEDLARRDFTVNAMAVPLGGSRRGQLDAAEHALEDLEGRRLRVLHDASFIDDPTRLLRLARYAARLGFAVEPHTAELAAQAVSSGALATVSGGRIGAELLLAAGEEDPLAAFSKLGELGVLAALGLPSSYDAALARRALSLLGSEGLPVVPLAVMLHGGASPTLEQLEIPAELRDRILSGAFEADALAERLQRAERPSELYGLLAGQPIETVALAGALSEQGREHAARWIAELRHVRLEIDGADLLQAGVPEGPEIGRRLRRALEAKLDGELDGGGAAAELQAALA